MLPGHSRPHRLPAPAPLPHPRLRRLPPRRRRALPQLPLQRQLPLRPLHRRPTPGDVIDLGDITDLGGPSLINDSVEKRADSEDWFSFTLTATRSVTLILDEQDYNADLILEDETGNELYASRDLGDGGDYINADLEPGTYYIGVEAVEDGENEYVLHYETWPVAEPANIEVKNAFPSKGPGESEDSEPTLRDHGTSPELGTGDLPGPPTTNLDYTEAKRRSDQRLQRN